MNHQPRKRLSEPLLNKRTQKPFQQYAASPSWLTQEDEVLVGPNWIRAGRNVDALFADAQVIEGHDRTGGASCEGNAKRLLGESPSPFRRSLLAWSLIALSLALALGAILWKVWP